MFLFIVVQGSQAVDIDQRKTLEVLGKAQSRVSIRLQDSDGFTQPIGIKAGDLIQWRNLAMIEIIRKRLRLTTLKYQRLDDLVAAIGLPREKLCTHCWDGSSYC